MKKQLIVLPLAIIICFMVGCKKDKIPASNALTGVWKVVETSTIENDGLESKDSYEHPSLYFFQEDYYCMMMVQGSEPRAEYENPWNPSDEEIIKAYNSILVNAGTYEIKDSIIIKVWFIIKLIRLKKFERQLRLYKVRTKRMIIQIKAGVFFSRDSLNMSTQTTKVLASY